MPTRPGRGSTGGTLVAALLCLGLVAGFVPPASAEPEAPVEETRPSETAGIDPVLDGVEVDDTAAVRAADADVEQAAARQGEAALRWLDLERARTEQILAASGARDSADEAAGTLRRARAELAAADAELEERRGLEQVLRAALAEEQATLRSVAASVFAGEPADRYAALGSLDDFTEADRRSATTDRGIELVSKRVDDARAPWAKARTRRREQEAVVANQADEVVEAQRRSDDAVAARDDASGRLDRAQAALDGARRDLDAAEAASRASIVDRREARLAADVAGSDLPLVALHAYWRASALAPCEVPWWVIAGIGKTETRHGSAFGSSLTAEGDTPFHIVGIPLDGRPGTMAIADTDGGRLDDDPVWDRAIGPMQFIPGTWARWAADGNADGEADPHNIYDASLGAAKYLCFSRGDLDSDATLRAAILAYNRSLTYVSKVLRDGAAYRDLLDLPESAERE